MDNIADYIIIVFFIASALVSLLKRKTDKQKGQEKQSEMANPIPQQRKPVQVSTRTQENPRKVTDPFEDIINIFGNYQKKEEEKSEVDKYFEDALKKSEEFHEPVHKPVQETRRTSFSGSRNVAKPVTVDLAAKGQEIVKINKRAEAIKSKLKNTSSMRELILINEILGKPKALRRII